MKLTQIILIATFLTGCDILPRAASIHDFGVGITNPAQRPKQASQHDLITVEAPKWLYDSRIRYRLLYAAPTQIKFYALDRWLAPPPELLQQLLQDNLGATFPITVYLEEFEQQFTGPEQAKVAMTLKVIVPKMAARQEKIQSFRFEQTCPSANAKGAITAFSTLTYKSVQAINAWLQVR